eukprot:2933043-Prymnesium_polylepis.1
MRVNASVPGHAEPNPCTKPVLCPVSAALSRLLAAPDCVLPAARPHALATARRAPLRMRGLRPTSTWRTWRTLCCSSRCNPARRPPPSPRPANPNPDPSGHPQRR